MMDKGEPVVIAGNWKMNNGVKETSDYFRHLKELLSARSDLERALATGSVQLVVFPPAISLFSAYTLATEVQCITGAQNIHWEKTGAFTGEISVPMVRQAGGNFALIGHSERRHIFGETIDMTAKKLAACRKNDLTPVLCIGETEEEREKDKTEEVLARQLDGAFKDTSINGEEFIYIAYEPVWAIGTGNTATPEDAESACRFIRGRITKRFGPMVSQKARILYGGSVKPKNARELLSQKNVNGVLVGGASLDPESFLEIAEAALS
jgi:triosephosphate isomerase